MNHRIVSDVDIEKIYSLHDCTIEAISLNGELQHLQDCFFSMVGLDTVFVHLFKVVICHVKSDISPQLNSNAVLFPQHVVNRVKELLLSHLINDIGDAEFCCKLIDVWALLREQLTHLEDLFAQVLVSFALYVFIDVF